MPELPEVETVRRGLTTHLVGRRIARIQVFNDRAVRRHAGGAVDFEAIAIGHRVADVRRRGKYLWWALDDGDAILAHLGMSGQFRVTTPTATVPVEATPVAAVPSGTPERPAGLQTAGLQTAAVQPAALQTTALLTAAAQLTALPPAAIDNPDGGPVRHPHLRIRFSFDDDGPDVDFLDQRTFGGMAFAPGGAELPGAVEHIARDPLDPHFSIDETVAVIRRKHTEIKRALLDQTVVSGIGNIYADEALWRAKVHYARPTAKMTRQVAERVLTSATEVMTAALQAGGTSFDSLYVNVNGESGYFDRSLNAYGREGEPCARCGRAIRRDAFMNRSSFFCPKCQPPPRRAAS
ncbi:MAG: bifunctional DNA-formamidopyrimidine glycosylase/DNA-(apurinic or apyrimidinic site) lyase [Nakamurella sp.]